jgi:hypothetical protein
VRSPTHHLPHCWVNSSRNDLRRTAALGATAPFVVDNGTQSGIFRFVSSGTDALFSSAELTEVAVLTGVATALADYLFAP